MSQPTLFPNETAKGMSRRTDPDTSRAAAREIAASLGDAQGIVASVAGAVPRTANELAASAYAKDNRYKTETYRKRVRELVRKGVLVEADSTRICSQSGKRAATFKRNDGQ